MNRIYVILIFLFFISCESNLLFVEPQPDSLEQLNEIPEKYWGKYLVESDSSILIVEKSCIITEKEALEYSSGFDERIADENCTTQERLVIVDEIQECVPLLYLKKNEVAIRRKYRDTLFEINDEDRLKIYGDYLFFNKKNEEEYWNVWVSMENEDRTYSLWLLQWDEESEENIGTVFGKVSKIDDPVMGQQYFVEPTTEELNRFLDKLGSMPYETLVPFNYEVEDFY